MPTVQFIPGGFWVLYTDDSRDLLALSRPSVDPLQIGPPTQGILVVAGTAPTPMAAMDAAIRTVFG